MMVMERDNEDEKMNFYISISPPGIEFRCQSETIVINLEGWKNDFLCGQMANDLCRDVSARILSSRSDISSSPLEEEKFSCTEKLAQIGILCMRDAGRMFDAYEIEVVLEILRHKIFGEFTTLLSVRTMRVEIKIPKPRH